MSVPGKGVSFSDQKDVMMKTTYISQDSSESKDSMEMGNLGTGMSGKSKYLNLLGKKYLLLICMGIDIT